MRLDIAALLAAALMTGGCATGYGKASIFGGYWDKAGPGEAIEVGFSGNGYIKPDRVQVYLLYRSAEVARERGKRYVSIYPSIAAAINDTPVSEATAHSLGGKPFGKVFVLLHDGPAPGALDADEVMARYGAEVKGTGLKAKGDAR